MKAEKTRPVPVIAEAILRKAKALGLTHEQVCERLKVNSAHFSRWRTGKRPPPDPRLDSSRDFYVGLAQFLDMSLGEVLSTVIFASEKESASLDHWISASLEDSKAKLNIPKFSEGTTHALQLIQTNLLGREKYVAVLLSSLQEYVTQVLHEEWDTKLHLRIKRLSTTGKRLP